MGSLRLDSVRSSRRRVIGAAVALVGILALLALVTSCGAAGNTTTTTTPSTTGAGATVTIKDFAFDPASVTVKVGESVTWTNQDSATHTIAGDNGGFQSGDLANGDSFSFTFDQAGTYTYHCGIHPNMKGTVIVQ